MIKRTSGRLLGLLHALSVGDDDLLRSCLVDEVHVPYRRKLVPGVDQALRAVSDAGIAGATISGAGPAIVLIANTEAKAEAGATALQTAFDAADMKIDLLHLRGRDSGAVPGELSS